MIIIIILKQFFASYRLIVLNRYKSRKIKIIRKTRTQKLFNTKRNFTVSNPAPVTTFFYKQREKTKTKFHAKCKKLIAS